MEFKPIPNVPWEAAADGTIRKRVYTRSRGRPGGGRIIKGAVNKYGYLQSATLCLDGIRRNLLLHRCVAAAWIGESDLQVNHMNGDKTDNRAENLEYVSAKENTDHANKIGLRQHKMGDRDRDEIQRMKGCGFSQSFLASLYGVSQSHVSRICRNKPR